MSIEHKVEQNTDEWMALRCGKITASAFDVLIPYKGAVDKFTKGQRTYLISVAAEILTGVWEDTYQSKAMKQGHEREPFARAEMAKVLDIPIRESGFWEYSPFVGVSPDGIGGFNEFTAEFKCPQPAAHMLYLLDMDEFLKKYRYQIKGQMWASGIDQAYYGSYNPDFPAEDILSYDSMYLLGEDKDLFDNRIGHAVDLLKEWTAGRDPETTKRIEHEETTVDNEATDRVEEPAKIQTNETAEESKPEILDQENPEKPVQANKAELVRKIKALVYHALITTKEGKEVGFISGDDPIVELNKFYVDLSAKLEARVEKAKPLSQEEIINIDEQLQETLVF
jgi:hypothetical protein